MRRTLIRPAVLAVCVTAVLSGCAGAEPGREPSMSSSGSSATSASPTATGPAGASAVPTGKKGKPRGLDLPKVDEKNASAVANAYVKTAYSGDARLDVSPNDAPRRAARWMTPALAKVYSTPLPGEGGASWAALEAADGYQTVEVVEMPNEATESSTRAPRYQQVKVTDRDSDGVAISQPSSLVLTVTLVRRSASAPWRVEEVQTS